jgi:hypothetical protein
LQRFRNSWATAYLVREAFSAHRSYIRSANQENSYQSKRRRITKDERHRNRQADGNNDGNNSDADAPLASNIENDDSDDGQTSIEYMSNIDHDNGSDDDREILSD